jgi:hypothetical protein
MVSVAPDSGVISYQRMRYLLIFASMAICCPASTIVTTQTSATLHTGDALEFLFSGFNFTNYTGSASASRVTFSLNTGLLETDSLFDVCLQSQDGSVVVPIADDLGFSDGIWKSSLYSGAISTLTASVTLTAAEQAALFGASGTNLVLLVLRNAGDTITVGLPNYSLLQTGTISLSGGSVSVGATPLRVYLESSPLVAGEVQSNQLTNSPEPASMALVLLGIGAGVWQRTRRRTSTGGNRKEA